MKLDVYSAIALCWIVLAAIWVAGMSFSKRAVHKQSIADRMGEIGLAFLGGLIVAGKFPLGSWENARFVPQSHSVALAGLVLTFAGCLFAVWARVTLGKNWSGRPSVKAEHELIVNGPYALTRHPIYTGMLLALTGTLLADGRWRCIAGFFFVLLALMIKMRYEERLMMQTFPQDYLDYRRRVKALIPGLF